MEHNITAYQQVPISACNDFGNQIMILVPTKLIKHEYHVIRWTYIYIHIHTATFHPMEILVSYQSLLTTSLPLCFRHHLFCACSPNHSHLPLSPPFSHLYPSSSEYGYIHSLYMYMHIYMYMYIYLSNNTIPTHQLN